MKIYVSLLVITYSFLLTSCSREGVDISEFEPLDGSSVAPWIGRDRAELEAAWDSEPQIDLFENTQTLTWTIIPPIDPGELEGQDWENGKEVDGLDEDMIVFMRNSLSRSCFAIFSVDSKDIVIDAKLRQFKGAKGCDTSIIPIPLG